MKNAGLNKRTWALPGFYDAGNARTVGFQADPTRLLNEAVAWRDGQGIKPAGSDGFRVHLLVIDAQKDFCFPEGSLFVGGRSGTGAMDDNDRLARFIYENMGRITELTCTLDTHFPYQIFSPSFWLDAAGNAPAAHTVITTAEVTNGTYRPNPAMACWLCNGNVRWLEKQVAYYCEELERAGKYTLYLWPPHCLLGSPGHALAGVIEEARLFHAFVRGAKNGVEIKGGNALTENYSVLAPEVLGRHDGKPLAQRNTTFVKTLLEADAVVIAGQAASHCVKSTIDDLLEQIQAVDPALAQKVYILRDCMSAVAVPDATKPGQFVFDFTDDAEKAFDRFAAAGMQLVDTRQPIADWVGMEATN